MTDILNSIGSVIWGAPMLIFFLFVSAYFTLKSGFFQLRGISIWSKATVGSLFKKEGNSKSRDSISRFGAFCSVLAACIGTGNIVGVATAVYSGGAGTVFWMWISAVFSMMTAYSENYLGIKYKTVDGGGAFYYIKNGVKMPLLSKAYAAFCLLSTLGMGNLAQSNSVTTSLNSEFGFNIYITAFITAFLCYIIIEGGVKRISHFSEVTVPVMSILYLALSGGVLFFRKERILPVIKSIFKEAFTLKAVNGYGMYKAMRYGISRGVFSNEAGLGSSTIIHCEADGATPEGQGMWAMFEVFCDTVFLCTVMALVILVSGKNAEYPELYGAELSIAAYSVLGEFAEKGIAVLTAVFAFASLSGCSFYGEKSAQYLFGKRASKIYKRIFLVLAFAGGICAPKLIWSVADIFNGLMAVPNLFSLMILRKEVSFPSPLRRRSE